MFVFNIGLTDWDRLLDIADGFRLLSRMTESRVRGNKRPGLPAHQPVGIGRSLCYLFEDTVDGPIGPFLSALLPPRGLRCRNLPLGSLTAPS